MEQEIFLKYEAHRDITFFFGAGASYAEGVPLQQEILSLIFDDAELSNSNAAKIVIAFIRENFAIDENCYPSMESIFGYLDYFISTNSCLGAKYPTEKLYEIKQHFINLIHYVISKKSKPLKEVYGKFWDIIKRGSRNISIITLNYDTLLDDSFEPLYPQYGFIDYCIPLMNYYHYEEFHKELEGFNWWINPREPIHYWGGRPKPIKIIKIHGSLNWKYCRTCNQVFLTPCNIEIDLNTMGFLKYEYGTCANQNSKSSSYICPLDSTRFEALIVPPSHIKQLTHPTINNLIDESAREIRVARKIVFIGYSFPDADIHIKALFKKNLRKDTEIIVINPSINNVLQSAYRALREKIVFIEKTFEEALSDRHIENIISNAQQS